MIYFIITRRTIPNRLVSALTKPRPLPHRSFLELSFQCTSGTSMRRRNSVSLPTLTYPCHRDCFHTSALEHTLELFVMKGRPYTARPCAVFRLERLSRVQIFRTFITLIVLLMTNSNRVPFLDGVGIRAGGGAFANSSCFPSVKLEDALRTHDADLPSSTAYDSQRSRSIIMLFKPISYTASTVRIYRALLSGTSGVMRRSPCSTTLSLTICWMCAM